MQQPGAGRFHVIARLVALPDTTPEHHDLLELLVHRLEHGQVREMACQPADHLLIQHVGRQDEDQDAAVLQQGQRALVEELFQPGAALAFVAQVAAGVPCEIAIRRVEPQEAEGLPRDHGVHQVTVDAVIDQQPGVGGPPWSNSTA